MGDFNIHMNNIDCSTTRDFALLLECFELHQLVDSPTHNKGHILDFVILNGLFVSHLCITELGLSDHRAIFFNMDLPVINKTVSRTINYRKWRSIEPLELSDYIDSSSDGGLLSEELNDKVTGLYSILSTGLDRFAPLKSRSVSFVRNAPWYTDELRSYKAHCRKIERRWCMSGLTVHHQAWKDSLVEYVQESSVNTSNGYVFTGVPLSRFPTLASQSLCNIVSNMKATTSVVDPIPTSLFKSCFKSLSIVNV